MPRALRALLCPSPLGVPWCIMALSDYEALLLYPFDSLSLSLTRSPGDSVWDSLISLCLCSPLEIQWEGEELWSFPRMGKGPQGSGRGKGVRVGLGAEVTMVMALITPRNVKFGVSFCFQSPGLVSAISYHKAPWWF